MEVALISPPPRPASLEVAVLEGERALREGDAERAYALLAPLGASMQAATNAWEAALLVRLAQALRALFLPEEARKVLLRFLEMPHAAWAAPYVRMAVKQWVEMGVADRNGRGSLPLEKVPGAGEEPLRSDLAYLRGREAEVRGQRDVAEKHFATVSAKSRFWADATYFRGLTLFRLGREKEAKDVLCLLADPDRTPKEAVLFGDASFFDVRDLARLALGRTHHDARSTHAGARYFSVPEDSRFLAEALFESATHAYEHKSFDTAKGLIQAFLARFQGHPLTEEILLLEAYVLLGACAYGEADGAFQTLLSRSEVERDALAQKRIPVKGSWLEERLLRDPAYKELTSRLTLLQQSRKRIERLLGEGKISSERAADLQKNLADIEVVREAERKAREAELVAKMLEVKKRVIGRATLGRVEAVLLKKKAVEQTIALLEEGRPARAPAEKRGSFPEAPLFPEEGEDWPDEVYGREAPR